MARKNRLDRDPGRGGTARGLLIGLLTGGLVGAGVMLFSAPQAGAKTRQQVRKRAIRGHERRDQQAGDRSSVPEPDGSKRERKAPVAGEQGSQKGGAGPDQRLGGPADIGRR
jgi:gas vesicle protein